MSDNQHPTYEWVDKHNARQDNVNRATADKDSAWKYAPGIVYTGAILLLSVVLGTEISKLFVGESPLLQWIGWGCVGVVGMSAIASFYGKGAVYKSKKQQMLGMLFWMLELLALTVGLIVAIADAFKFSGLLVDIGRFFGFMSVVVAAFGWGVVRWAGPDWKVIAQKNRTDADLSVKLAEIDSQHQLSDEIMALRMETARMKARRDAELDHDRALAEPTRQPIRQLAMPTVSMAADSQVLAQTDSENGHHPKNQ